MNGKVTVVTGGSSGIGFEVARAAASLGSEVLIIARNEEMAIRARDRLRQLDNGPTVEFLPADLASQEQVRAVARALHQRFDHLDVLVNNAGSVFSIRTLTNDGVESTFAVNHLAPFLLTHLTYDLLRAAPSARVVNVTTEVHSSRLDFDNLQGERNYGFLSQYARSKLCLVLFTYELARRLEGSRITANCASPGPSRTHFGDNLTGAPALFPKVMKNIPFLFRSPAHGARTIVQLATDPSLADVTGEFYFRGRPTRSKPISYDRSVAAHLWNESERLCRLSEDERIPRPWAADPRSEPLISSKATASGRGMVTA